MIWSEVDVQKSVNSDEMQIFFHQSVCQRWGRTSQTEWWEMSGLSRYTLLPFHCVIRAAVSAVVQINQPLCPLHAYIAEVMSFAGFSFCLPLPRNGRFQI